MRVNERIGLIFAYVLIIGAFFFAASYTNRKADAVTTTLCHAVVEITTPIPAPAANTDQAAKDRVATRNAQLTAERGRLLHALDKSTRC